MQYDDKASYHKLLSLFFPFCKDGSFGPKKMTPRHADCCIIIVAILFHKMKKVIYEYE